MGGTVLPPYCLAWGQTVNLGSTGDSLTLTGKSYCLLWGHCFFLLAPGAHRVLCVCVCVCALWESVSPVLWKFCNQTPLASKVKFTGGSQSFCWIPRLANLLWVLELYLKVWEFLWYNCSAVCGSSVQQFYAGAKGDLLQEGLCHRLHDPGLLQGVTKLICIYHIWFIHLSAYEHEHIN